jgi:hypothetical protein
MIAKTTMGSSFIGAINYGAGYSLDGKEIEGKSELLLLHNVVSQDPLGILDNPEYVDPLKTERIRNSKVL